MAAGRERDRARTRPRRLALGRWVAGRDPRGLGSGGARSGRDGAPGRAHGADRPRPRAAARPRARRLRTGDLRRARARSAIRHGRPPPPAAAARRPHVARLLGRDDRRVGAGGARRDRDALPPVCADAFDGDGGRARARPLRLRRRPDRPRPAPGGGSAARQPAHAQPAERTRAVPRRPHLHRAGAAACTRASAPSSGGSPTGSTAASSAAPARRGCSACGSTSGTRATRARRLLRRRARAVVAGGRRPDPRPPHLPPARRRRCGLRLPPLGRPADRRAPPARPDRARPRRGWARVRPARADDDRAE